MCKENVIISILATQNRSEDKEHYPKKDIPRDCKAPAKLEKVHLNTIHCITITQVIR
jgi:hypothetical protein